MNLPDTAEGRRLLGSAFPAPWSSHDDAMMHIAAKWPNNVRIIATMTDIERPGGIRSSANRDAIVWLFNNAAALLDAAEAVQRVRELHRLRRGPLCTDCNDDWPCTTIRALEGGVPSVSPQPETCEHGETGRHNRLDKWGMFVGPDCPGPGPVTATEGAVE